MKLNDAQEAHLVHIQQAARRLREAKAHEYEIARQQAEQRIRSFEIELQKAVADGERAGIPYAQLAKRGMGVQNGTTARLAAEAGRPYLDDPVQPQAEATASVSDRYELQGERLLVTLQPEDFEGKIPGINEPQTLAFDMQAGRPIPEGNEYSHPVARMVLTPAGREEVAAFLERVAA